MRIVWILTSLVWVAACDGVTSRDGGATQRLPDNRNFTPQSREPGLTVSGHVDVGIVRTF